MLAAVKNNKTACCWHKHIGRGGRCSGEDLAIFASAGQKMSSIHVPEKPYAKSVFSFFPP